MSKLLRSSAGAVVALLLVGGVSGCAPADTTSDETETPAAEESTEEKIFEGTAEEHLQAIAQCMIDSGYPTTIVTQAGDDPSMEVDFGADTEEAFEAALAAEEECSDKVGKPEAKEISTEAQVREMYDWVAGQYACIEAAGYQVAPMQTWESYLDEWNRTGSMSGDAFVFLVNSQADHGAAMAACPRTTESW